MCPPPVRCPTRCGLAEDLVLAGDRRIESCGHLEQVGDGLVVVVHVQAVGEHIRGQERQVAKKSRTWP